MEGGQVPRSETLCLPAFSAPLSGMTPTPTFTGLSPGAAIAQLQAITALVPVEDAALTRPAIPVGDVAQTHTKPAGPVEDAAQTPAKPAAPGEDDPSYERWDSDAQELLLEWLEKPGNYALYRSSGRPEKSNGSTITSGKKRDRRKFNGSIDKTPRTKAQVLQLISEFLASKTVIKTTAQIGNKVKYFEQSHRKATEYLRKIGKGVTDIPHKVLNMCPLYKRLDAFMSYRVSSTQPTLPSPPNLGESLDTGTTDMFRTGTYQTSATESTTAEGLKGLTEAVLSLGEQNRKLGEQKLVLRAEWQSKQFEVLHRKLDLQQQEISLRLKELDSRNLKMQLQLERLRAKRRRRGGSSGSAQEEYDSDC